MPMESQAHSPGVEGHSQGGKGFCGGYAKTQTQAARPGAGVMRLLYSIRREQSYRDWLRRYIKLHRMRLREELIPGGGKIEMFLRACLRTGSHTTYPNG